MRERTTMLAACLLAATLGTAQAQTVAKRKPGLWEVTQTRQDSQIGGQALPSQKEIAEMMAQMPPEQRKQMEAAMRQQGVGMSAARPNTLRYCLTPEMAQRDEMAMPPDADMKCQHSVKPVSAKETRFSFVCSGPNGKFQGEGRSWDVGPEGYKTATTMRGTVEGQPMTMKMEQSGRWLGADCKGLKPIAAQP